MIYVTDSYFLTYKGIDDDGKKVTRTAFNYADPREILAKIKELGLEFLEDITIRRRHVVTVTSEASLDDLRESGCTDEDIEAMLPYLR